MREDGLNWHVYRKWEGDISSLTSSSVEKVIVGAGHSIMIYFLLCFGYLASFFSLALELFYIKCVKKEDKERKHFNDDDIPEKRQTLCSKCLSRHASRNI